MSIFSFFVGKKKEWISFNRNRTLGGWPWAMVRLFLIFHIRSTMEWDVCTKLFIQSSACLPIQSNACLHGGRYSILHRKRNKSEKRGWKQWKKTAWMHACFSGITHNKQNTQTPSICTHAQRTSNFEKEGSINGRWSAVRRRDFLFVCSLFAK